MRPWPTPASAERTSIPRSFRCPTGPMPERSRWAGEWIAPQDRITSRARNSVRVALDMRDHADAPLAFEQQLAHLRVGRDREIAALAGGRIKVADGRGDAPLIGIGDRDGVVAVLPFAVLVGQVVEARGLERLGCGLGVPVPQVGEDAPHGNAPLLAVQWPRRNPCRARPSCNTGSTSFQPQPRAPRDTHSSKSAGEPRLASWPLMEEPPPRMRACSYLRSGGGLSSGLLWETTSVRTLSSVQWKRGSK